MELTMKMKMRLMLGPDNPKRTGMFEECDTIECSVTGMSGSWRVQPVVSDKRFEESTTLCVHEIAMPEIEHRTQTHTYTQRMKHSIIG